MTKCYFHDLKDAVSVCTCCGKHLCSDCAVELSSGTYCKDCLEGIVNKRAQTSDVVRRNAFLTFIFSTIPGLGHVYQGFTNKGYQLLLTFFGFITLSVQFSPIADYLVFVLPLLFFYSVFDAQHLRRKVVSGLPVDPTQGFIGGKNHMELLAMILIALGGLEVIDQIGTRSVLLYNIKRTIDDILPPSLFILAGIYLLRRKEAASRTEGRELNSAQN